ncbi:MAG: helix-turn-helix transcriptional regulator [Proteobacteria bacterium]|nr:helix-turn-helix transcriptional regulator [Pseudomonadota bacterium]
MEIKNKNAISAGNILKNTNLYDISGIHFLGKNCLPNILSQRELECFFYLIRGKTAKSIAKMLGISYRTVETHIDHLKNKLNCSSKTELIEYAVKVGFAQVVLDNFSIAQIIQTLKE